MQNGHTNATSPCLPDARIIAIAEGAMPTTEERAHLENCSSGCKLAILISESASTTTAPSSTHATPLPVF